MVPCEVERELWLRGMRWMPRGGGADDGSLSERALNSSPYSVYE